MRRLTASRSWLATRFSRLAGIDPEVLRYGAWVSVWGRWFVWLVVVVELAYRLETSYPHQWYFLLVHVLLVLFNGFLHYWLLSKRPVTWHWLVALSAMDIALITAGPVIAGEFRTIHYLGYYPALALVAVILSSFTFILAWTTVVAALYTVVSMTQGSGLDMDRLDDKAPIARVAAMYAVVAIVGLIVRSSGTGGRRRWSGRGLFSANASISPGRFTIPWPRPPTWSASGFTGPGSWPASRTRSLSPRWMGRPSCRSRSSGS